MLYEVITGEFGCLVGKRHTRYGKGEAEGGSGTRSVACPRGAAMQLNDTPDDGKAKAVPSPAGFGV